MTFDARKWYAPKCAHTHAHTHPNTMSITMLGACEQVPTNEVDKFRCKRCRCFIIRLDPVSAAGGTAINRSAAALCRHPLTHAASQTHKSNASAHKQTHALIYKNKKTCKLFAPTLHRRGRRNNGTRNPRDRWVGGGGWAWPYVWVCEKYSHQHQH